MLLDRSAPVRCPNGGVPNGTTQGAVFHNHQEQTVSDVGTHGALTGAAMMWNKCWLAGMSAKEAAEACGLSINKARAWSYSTGQKFRYTRSAARVADPDRIRDLAADGYTKKTIGEMLGVSRERIRQICARDNISTRRGGVDYDTRDAVLALHDEGLHPAEIERRLRITNVAGRLRAFGVEPHATEAAPLACLRTCAEQGMTLSAAAREAGIPVQYAWNLKERHGVTFAKRARSQGRPPVAVTEAQVRECIAAGLGVSASAARLGVTMDAMTRAANRAGLVLPRQKSGRLAKLRAAE